MFKCAFFDFDDTMVRTMDLQYESYRQALKMGAGFELTRDTFEKYAGLNGKEILKSILGDNHLVEDIYNIKHIIHKSRDEKVKPVKNVIKLYEILQDKYIVGIVTSGRRSNVERVLIDLKLNSNYILTSDEYTGPPKPNPGIYLQAMKDLNLKSEECIGFEDSYPGLAALTSAGIFAIDVKNFYKE